jgi:hypothetical protein
VILRCGRKGLIMCWYPGQILIVLELTRLCGVVGVLVDVFVKFVV